MKPTLKITFDPGYGRTPLVMQIDLSEGIVRKIEKIKPPIKHSVPWLRGAVALESFEDVVEIIKTREFRKKLFIDQAENLGRLLAERMEDAEGWHDVSRIEPAARSLRGESL